jgi:hypothetical protein|tara:strand:- start:944 stop:1138 length:195 start_codon:yes stop_codon:yes gene_type:complete
MSNTDVLKKHYLLDLNNTNVDVNDMKDNFVDVNMNFFFKNSYYSIKLKEENLRYKNNIRNLFKI